MKKANSKDEDMRADYVREDFPGGFVRGKYAERLRDSSNVVVLRPEVAAVFTTDEAVNSALLSLIEIANKAARPAEP